MSGWTVVPIALAAAAGFAASSALKHRSATHAPSAVDLGARSLGRLISATVRHPLWLAGIAVDVVALALQIVALHLGSLAIVQPVLVANLIFAFLLRGHLSRRELGWAALITVALAGFVSLSGSARAVPAGQVDRLPAVLAALVGLAVVAGLLGWGRSGRMRNPAAALGVGVGVIYAATAALLKALSDRAVAAGVLGLFTSWQLYAVIVVGAAGVLMNQMTFQAGPLSVSLPAISSIDPLASIVIGVAVFDEHIRRGLLSGLGLGSLLALLVLGVVMLARGARTDSPRPMVSTS